ncbi:MAG: 4Fe-4S binding protein [Candidatus Omnitrophica bacterium]|nr:4Fe-4S binding protein [Candidatus Omnitrophota bacterium]
MSFKIKIDEERCKGCYLCVMYCPKKAIVEGKGVNKKGFCYVIVQNAAACAGCKNCVVMCPESAIEIIPAKGACLPDRQGSASGGRG